MKRALYLAGILLTLGSCRSTVQTESLRQRIEQITSTRSADVGVSIVGLDGKDLVSINGDKHYPMQSVFKFHIALTVLNEVDNGRLALNQEVELKKSDLLPNTWSPLREKYGDGNVKIPLSEILQYTVAQSDNNGCDILLRLVGGTKRVGEYIHRIGITDFSIQANEEEMHREWNIQFSNWTTPSATTDLLKIFHDRKILSQSSFDFLWKTMIETTTGRNRIKGELPAGTPVAHKTGTSGTNDEGITAAVNDVGIVTLPNGKQFAIAIYVSNSKENSETNEKIIAEISRAAWDYFIGRGE